MEVAMSNQKPAEMLVEKLVNAIESGMQTGKWIRPWKGGSAQNALSGHIYSGNNAMYLAMYRAFAQTEHTQFYATFPQWSKLGAKVKAGAKGITLVKNPTMVDKKDANEEVIGQYVYWRHIVVFNSTQVEGWEPPVEVVKESETAVRDRFTAMLERHHIRVNTGFQAYYRPSSDEITMPAVKDFPVEDQYWATLAHETIHWTGHPSRLARINIGNHKDKAYAFEELVAELGSVFVASTFGITPESDANILSYLANWNELLKQDKTAIRRALSLANEAVNFLK